MLRPRSALVLLLLGAGCRGSDPHPLELIRSEPLLSPGPLLAGGGTSDVVGYGQPDGFLHWRLQLVRQDAAAPDALADVGAVTVDGGPPDRLAMSSTRAALSIGAQVTAVDLTDPSLPAIVVQASARPDCLQADGRWLLVSSGAALELFDLQGPARFAFSTGQPVTGILATQGSFLAFTTSGFAHLVPDVAAPSFVDVANHPVRGFAVAFVDGVEAVAAGPAAAATRSRVARLDLRNPRSPAILRAAEVEGAYGDFAWDGGTTSVLEILGLPGAGTYQGYVLREHPSGFSATGVPLPQWMGGRNNVAARRDRLFLLGEESRGHASAGVAFGYWRIR